MSEFFSLSDNGVSNGCYRGDEFESNKLSFEPLQALSEAQKLIDHGLIDLQNFCSVRSEVSVSDWVFGLGVLLAIGVDKGDLSSAFICEECGTLDPLDYLVRRCKYSNEELYKSIAAYFEFNFIHDTEYLCIDSNENISRCLGEMSHLILQQRKEKIAQGSIADKSNRLLVAPDFYQCCLWMRQKCDGLKLPTNIIIALPSVVKTRINISNQKGLTNYAIDFLHQHFSYLSSKKVATGMQLMWLATLVGGFYFSVYYFTFYTLFVISTFLSFLFAASISLKFTALIRLLRLGAHNKDQSKMLLSNSELPVLSFLVPLYKEELMIEQLVESLNSLDYPKQKLDINFIIESDDVLTKQAVANLIKGWSHCSMVVVPYSLPRSKPKAMNYTLPLCKGDFVCVFDAEDIPHKLQARAAISKFYELGEKVAVIQAPLAISNAFKNWFTFLFASEYAVQFQVLMPALASWNSPILLGGTSNYFRKDILVKLGGWDAYNVTEDADLGIRIARYGYRCACVLLPTWEEAPESFGGWLKQRTRWLKGWMQTWLVHNRSPRLLFKELGVFKASILHLVLSSFLLSIFFHPISVILGLFQICFYLGIIGIDIFSVGYGLLFLLIFLVVIGYGLTMIISYVALSTLGRVKRPVVLLLMPIYWLLISFAGFISAFELYLRPYYWAKTSHKPVTKFKPRI